MTKYKWQCSLGHTWKGRYNDVQQGTWCPDPICVANKIKSSFLKKYGVKNVFQNEEIKQKIKQINLEKYGVEFTAQNKDIALKTARSLKNSYFCKHWETKKNVVCTGTWERNVVNWLNDKKIKFIWQPETFKTPFFTERGNVSTYRPDLFLVEEEKWVEIKGWFRTELSKKKWNWFHKKHPNSELWNKAKLRKLKIL